MEMQMEKKKKIIYFFFFMNSAAHFFFALHAWTELTSCISESILI